MSGFVCRASSLRSSTATYVTKGIWDDIENKLQAINNSGFWSIYDQTNLIFGDHLTAYIDRDL